MRIRKQQMHALQRQQGIAYELRLARFLREQFPDAARESEAALIDGIRTLVANARRYGLASEQQIAIYVVSGWLLGDRFDEEFPAAKQILGADMPAEEKSQLLERFTEELFDTLAGQS